MRLTKNFVDTEFRCRCCGKLLDSEAFQEFVAKLQEARTIADIPFVITSGYRCEKHNKAVGGKWGSSHRKAIAVDLRVRNDFERYKILKGLLDAGFERIGIHPNFFHVDLDMAKQHPVIWSYG